MNYDINRLTQILTFKRPHGSPSLDEMVKEVFAGYEVDTLTAPNGDPLALRIITNGASETLFSCHLDTVHRSAGRQILAWDEEMELMYKPEGGDDECLGADDGAGVWLLLEMIDAAVPGTYLFHYGEERGGIGSTGMATHYAEYLQQFKRAVAFDRRGDSSIITHQGWGRCCSDAFGEALSDAFNSFEGFRMLPDNTGIFTDTANYTDLIPECTNVSCGYDGEHTKGEVLDVAFLVQLLEAAVQLDWEALPTVRIAAPEPVKDFSFGGSRRYADDIDSLMGLSYSALLKWVKKNAGDPQLIADVLYDACDRIAASEEQAGYGTAWADADDADESEWDDSPLLDVGMR